MLYLIALLIRLCSSGAARASALGCRFGSISALDLEIGGEHPVCSSTSASATKDRSFPGESRDARHRSREQQQLARDCGQSPYFVEDAGQFCLYRRARSDVVDRAFQLAPWDGERRLEFVAGIRRERCTAGSSCQDVRSMPL